MIYRCNVCNNEAMGPGSRVITLTIDPSRRTGPGVKVSFTTYGFPGSVICDDCVREAVKTIHNEELPLCLLL
jgi:hypothetical protein